MASANSLAAEVPLAASLLELCSGESWCGWARIATAAITSASTSATTQPRMFLKRPYPPRFHWLAERGGRRLGTLESAEVGTSRPAVSRLEGKKAGSQGAPDRRRAGRSRATVSPGLLPRMLGCKEWRQRPPGAHKRRMAPTRTPARARPVGVPRRSRPARVGPSGDVRPRPRKMSTESKGIPQVYSTSSAPSDGRAGS